MNEFDEGVKEDLTIRERHRQMTREAILEAACAVFQESGLRAATVDQITTRAKVNRATFYLHFKDKTDVAASLARRLVSRGKEHYGELGALKSPTRTQVRKWVEGYLEFVTEHRMLSLMLTEAISTEPNFAQEYLDYLGRIADIRLEGLLVRVTGKSRAILRSKIVLLQMMMSHYAHHTIGQSVRFPGDVSVEALAEIWWNEVFASKD